MFTGIVEEKGSVRYMQLTGESGVLAVKAKKVLERTKIGDSIAVNGVCLTVTSLQPDGFTADVMAETIRRSSLGSCKVGSQVNLERAMAADGRFGGHIVAGHVDGTGCILRIEKDDNAVWFTIHAEPNLLRYVVEKGSIAVDGISLTVAEVSSDAFSVSTIPSHRQLYKSVSKAQKRCGKSGDRHPWQVCRKAVSADTAGTPAKLCHKRNADTLRI